MKKDKVIILDGIRRKSDMEYLKDIQGFSLVFIDAKLEKIFERLKTRREKIDDKKKSMKKVIKDGKKSKKKVSPKNVFVREINKIAERPERKL